MHLDSRRAPRFLRAITNPSGISARHWSFQERLARPHIELDAVVFSTGQPFGREDADGIDQPGLDVCQQGHLNRILRNRVYIGEITHKGESYPGLHDAIISPELWQAVEDRIDANRHGTRRKAVAAPVNPLSGKLVDEAGERLVASHAQKKGRKYRYYISAFLIRKASDETRRGWRVPTPALETLVLTSLDRFLASPAMLTDAWRNAGQPLTSLQPVIASLQHKRNGQDARHDHDLIEQVVLSPAGINLHIDLASLVTGTPVIIHEVLVTMAQRGIEMRLVHERRDHTPVNVDATLIKAIARGHRWFQQMRTDGIGLEELARTEGVSARYIVRLARLAFLSPAIVSKIAEGRQPIWLNAQTLANNITIAHAWADQASQLLAAKAA